jgi:iron-sulfur cluster assembly protein
MALDEPKENDQVFTEKGVTFIINRELYKEVQPVSIDFVESAMGAGFMVKSELTNKGGGCGGGTCSC